MPDMQSQVLKSPNFIQRRARDLAPLFSLVVMIIFFSVVTDNFLSLTNIRNILAQTSTLAIAATGITFVLLCAEIDLSIAAVGTLTGVIAAFLFGTLGLPSYLSVIASAVIAMTLGWLNGFTTTRTGLPSFMITLATMQIATGAGQHITQGKILYSLPSTLEYLGGGYIGTQEPFRFPVVVICGVVILMIGHFVLNYTRFGRYVYMTGSNREAARLSGINTKNIIASCLAISALTAGMAGMLNTGRLGSAQGYGMESMLLDSISAVVLGGTSLFGGEGGIKNTVIGLLIFGVLNNGLNMLQLDIFVRLWLYGVILLMALIINVYALRLRKH